MARLEEWAWICAVIVAPACTSAPEPRAASPDPAATPSTAPTAPEPERVAPPAPPRWHWENPLPQGNVLRAVVAPSPTEILAVGRAGTLVHSKDGGETWTAKDIGASTELFGIHSPGPGHIVVVGSQVSVVSKDGGETWTAQKRAELLSDVWGSGPDDLHAVGHRGAVLHSADGGLSWAPQASGVEASLRAVWGSGPADIYVAGTDGTLLHCTDGRTWTRVTTAVTGTLEAIAGGGRDDVFVAGDEGLLRSIDAGASWTAWPVVHGTREATDEEKEDGVAGPVPIEHSLRGVWRPGPGELFVLADDILHSKDDGKTWRVAHTVTDGRYDGRLFAITGSDASHLFVVGDGGMILRSSDAGLGWTRRERGPSAGLFGVWGRGPGDVFVVGGGGLILHGDGATWTTRHDGGDRMSLVSVGGDAEGNVYATGGNATILRSAGGDGPWTRLPVAGLEFETITDFQADATGRLRALSEAGVVVGSDHGQTWTLVPRAADQFMGAIWWSGPTEAFGASNRGIFHTTDETTWVAQKTALGQNINAVWGSGPADVYVAGRHGLFLRSTDGGKTWPSLKETTKFHGSINALWGPGRDEVYAVGDGGAILHTTDGGATWARERSPTDLDLQAIWGTPGHIYAVGDHGTIVHYY